MAVTAQHLAQLLVQAKSALERGDGPATVALLDHMQTLTVAAEALKAAKAPALLATFKRAALPGVVAAARKLEGGWKEALGAAELKPGTGLAAGRPNGSASNGVGSPSQPAAAATASGSASASASATSKSAAAGGAGQASLLEFYPVANGGSGGAASSGGSNGGSAASRHGTSSSKFGDGVPRPSPAPKEHTADVLAAALTGASELATDQLAAALGFDYSDAATVAPGRVLTAKAGGKSAPPGAPVVYWMSREQRVADNWALLHARARAKATGGPLVVVFNLVPVYLSATARAYGFMLRGLRQVEADLAALRIPFRLLLGHPRDNIAGYANAIGAASVVADFNPLRVNASWRKDVADALAPGIALEVVDAHNIVPCWHASDKQEVGARTIRRKIHTKLYDYVKPFPPVTPNEKALAAGVEAALRFYDPRAAGAASASSSSSSATVADSAERVQLAPRNSAGTTDWAAVLSHLTIDWSVPEVAWCTPGERAAAAALNRFLHPKLKAYDSDRNNPTLPGGSSNLSPYLHFGAHNFVPLCCCS